jgi:hypothetical protein
MFIVCKSVLFKNYDKLKEREREREKKKKEMENKNIF